MKSGMTPLGDVVFDRTARALNHKNGRPVQLRNKSKDVLVFLLENPNRTVKKAEILNAVWTDVTASDESLVQCIADIRRLIGPDARKIVETVPREGYRINVQQSDTTPKHVLSIAGGLAVVAVLAAVGIVSLNSDAPPENTANLEAPLTSSSPPGTDVTEAYLEVLQGRISANRYSLSESLLAEKHFRRAISLDPGYARAYAELGTLLAVRFENNWTVLEDADRDKALHYAEKAVSIDPGSWLAHYALGRLHSLNSDLDLAEAHLEKAMSLEPGNEDARAYYGIVANFRGDSKEAAAILDQAVRSHPSPPYWYYYALGSALLNEQRYDEARRALNMCLDLAERSPYCLRYLIAVHGKTGDAVAAEAASLEYASMGFELSLASIMELLDFHHPSDLDHLEQAFRLAGVPE